jgi:prevent-host-death family protein
MRGHKKPAATRASARASVGVRELKAHAARIVRSVRETRASYIVTHRGRAVGMLLPVDAEPVSHEDGTSAWTTFLEAGRRLQRAMPARTSIVKLLSDSRR